MEREQEPLTKKLKLMFLFNPLTEWIDTTHAMRMFLHSKSVQAGKEEGTLASHNQIKGFVEYYNINMDDFEPSDIENSRLSKTSSSENIKKVLAPSPVGKTGQSASLIPAWLPMTRWRSQRSFGSKASTSVSPI